eukprot:COSAG04_NODE_3574_length_2698_cov_1.464409_2_plen_221_part_00
MRPGRAARTSPGRPGSRSTPRACGSAGGAGGTSAEPRRMRRWLGAAPCREPPPPLACGRRPGGYVYIGGRKASVVGAAVTPPTPRRSSTKASSGRRFGADDAKSSKRLGILNPGGQTGEDTQARRPPCALLYRRGRPKPGRARHRDRAAGSERYHPTRPSASARFPQGVVRAVAERHDHLRRHRSRSGSCAVAGVAPLLRCCWLPAIPRWNHRALTCQLR